MVSIKNRKRPTQYVDLISPHGAHVQVRTDRAEALLQRPAIAFGDSKFRRWSLAEESDDGKPEEVSAEEAKEMLAQQPEDAPKRQAK